MTDNEKRQKEDAKEAYKSRQTIEFWDCWDSQWKETTNPIWSPSVKYRIKNEQVKYSMSDNEKLKEIVEVERHCITADCDSCPIDKECTACDGNDAATRMIAKLMLERNELRAELGKTRLERKLLDESLTELQKYLCDEFHLQKELADEAQAKLDALAPFYPPDFNLDEHEKCKVQSYRKKPVLVRAIKWDGKNLQQVIEFTGQHVSASHYKWEEYEDLVKREGLKIFTLEGSHMADIGDFIIEGVAGENYPCKPYIFEETYYCARGEDAIKKRKEPAPDEHIDTELITDDLAKLRPMCEVLIGVVEHEDWVPATLLAVVHDNSEEMESPYVTTCGSLQHCRVTVEEYNRVMGVE